MKYTDAPRIQTIDIIRGIALFGILAMNIQTYDLFVFLRTEQVYALGIDRPYSYAPAQFIIHFLFKGQFYTIYSFLFGLGFYLMMEKNKRMGLSGNRLFKRRLWLLLIFGLIHAFIFWFGDILHKYALLGFTLIYFNKKSISTLLKWIGGLISFGILLQLIKAVFFSETPASLETSHHETDKLIMQVVNTWQHGSFMEVLSMQKLGVLMGHVMVIQGGMVNYLHYEIMFLLGLIAGKINVFNRVSELKPQLKRAAIWLIVPAVLLKGFSCIHVPDKHVLPATMLSYEIAAFSLAGFIGTLLLTLTYLIFLTLMFQGKQNRFFTWIGNTGRLGLTNYFAQTFICMIVFYGYALGWSGHLTLLQLFLPIVLIYAFQVSYSNLWLTYHKLGPMEMLWRRLTYGKGQSGAVSPVAIA